METQNASEGTLRWVGRIREEFCNGWWSLTQIIGTEEGKDGRHAAPPNCLKAVKVSFLSNVCIILKSITVVIVTQSSSQQLGVDICHLSWCKIFSLTIRWKWLWPFKYNQSINVTQNLLVIPLYGRTGVTGWGVPPLLMKVTGAQCHTRICCETVVLNTPKFLNN